MLACFIRYPPLPPDGVPNSPNISVFKKYSSAKRSTTVVSDDHSDSDSGRISPTLTTGQPSQTRVSATPTSSFTTTSSAADDKEKEGGDDEEETIEDLIRKKRKKRVRVFFESDSD